MAKLRYIELINDMVLQGYINVQKHPVADIYSYNYSKSCSLDGVWNEATRQCRGVIVDKDYNILSRPFEKFFNYEELTDKSIIPPGKATAWDKLDGSLGIVYWIDDTPYIATRGSFSSEQAIHATNLLHTKYRDTWGTLRKIRDLGYTVLFEIIYPENRIVVNYGDMDDIVLIAIVNNEREGDELDIRNYSDIFTTATCYGEFEDWLNIRDLISGDNREGFVLSFPNGFRMKMKYEDYFRLHRLRSYLTKKHIFEFIETGRQNELNEMKDQFDEEIRISIDKIVDEFHSRYLDILLEAKAEYKEFDTDKEAAEYFKTCKWQSILFALRKDKPVSHIIWKQVKRELKEEE